MKNKKILILFSIMIMLFTIIPINNVSGAEGDITLTDWDDVASGLDSGTSGYFDFENTGTANYFQTSTSGDLSAPNSFDVAFADDAPVLLGRGYWNLTEDFSYIYSINFSFVYDYASLNEWVIMYFYDSNAHNVIRLKWNNAGDVQFYDISTTSYKNIYTSLVDGSRYYLNIEHNLTNNFYIECLNSSFGVVGTLDSAGSYAGTYTNFSYIYFDSFVQPGATGPTYHLYIDDIIINTESEAGETGGYDEFPGLILDKPVCGVIGSIPMMRYMEWYGAIRDTKYNTHHLLWGTIPCPYLEIEQDKYRTTNIYYVDLYVSTEQYTQISSNGNSYSCRVNNNPFVFVSFIPKTIGYTNGYIMRFAGNASLTNDKPLFSFYCSADYDDSTYGDDIHWFPCVLSGTCNYDARKHENSGDFLDNQLDGVPFNNPSGDFDGWYFVTGYVSPYVQYWYSGGDDSGDTSPIPTNEQANLTITYGDSFIEFYHQGLCDYGIGSRPTIVYHLNNTQCNLYNKYLFEIINIATEEVVMNGFIDFTVSDSEVFDKMQIQKKFTEMGQYYIALWNLTTDVQKDELVLTSQDTVIVCENGNVGLDETDEGIDTSNTGDIGFAIATMPVYIKVMAAIFIIILLTVSPYFFVMLISKTGMKVELPSLVYVAFFFTGLVMSIILGLLDYWVLFVVLFGLIITLAILWIQKNDIGGGE